MAPNPTHTGCNHSADGTLLSKLKAKEKAMEASMHPRPRIGKTAKDKDRDHIPYKKNRRVWEENTNGRISRDSNGHATTGNWAKL